MKRLFIVGVASCLLATSCTLTGDPTKGGIFWSPSKAQERQLSLQEELDGYNASLDAQNKQKDLLTSQRKKLSTEISKMEREVKTMQNSGAGDAETKALLQEISRRKARLEALR